MSVLKIPFAMGYRPQRTLDKTSLFSRVAMILLAVFQVESKRIIPRANELGENAESPASKTLDFPLSLHDANGTDPDDATGKTGAFNDFDDGIDVLIRLRAFFG